MRILRSEKAEEFTKGLERAWFKHFGLPKVLRIDEAKGWSSKHVREWAASRGIEIEVQPAESHSWLSVVERKYQVVRRALELYQDDIGRHDLAALKEAAIYVPHSINQLSFHRGFSPQQWVLGKTMNYAHGLSGEVFNPGQDLLDDQGAFALVQQRRVAAGQAFIKADSDAKLRRAFTQKFVENKEELAIGQRCWYWRDAGASILRRARWRGPARVVAIEPVGDTHVLWLCHGTSLVRCSPRQVRPLVEESGAAVPADRSAALRDLEELKARSTTQPRDVRKKPKGKRLTMSPTDHLQLNLTMPRKNPMSLSLRSRHRRPCLASCSWCFHLHLQEMILEMNVNDHPEGDVDLMSPQKPHFQNHHHPMLHWILCHRSESLQELPKGVQNDFEQNDLVVDVLLCNEEELPDGWTWVDGWIEVDEVYMNHMR